MWSDMDDIYAIERLGIAYSVAASSGDLDGILLVFTDDGILSGMPRFVGLEEDEVKGHKAIRSMFEGFLPGIEFIHQISQLASAEVSGDTATAKFMVTEHVRWRGQDLAIFLGYYRDDLVRTANGWRFARRALTARAAASVKADITTF